MIEVGQLLDETSVATSNMAQPNNNLTDDPFPRQLSDPQPAASIEYT